MFGILPELTEYSLIEFIKNFTYSFPYIKYLL